MNFNEIKFQDAKTQTYLGSPSIVRLADGTLLATHDYFGKGCPLNHEHEEHLTSVYHSDNDGGTWVNLTHIANADNLIGFDVSYDINCPKPNTTYYVQYIPSDVSGRCCP